MFLLELEGGRDGVGEDWVVVSAIGTDWVVGWDCCSNERFNFFDVEYTAVSSGFKGTKQVNFRLDQVQPRSKSRFH